MTSEIIEVTIKNTNGQVSGKVPPSIMFLKHSTAEYKGFNLYANKNC